MEWDLRKNAVLITGNKLTAATMNNKLNLNIDFVPLLWQKRLDWALLFSGIREVQPKSLRMASAGATNTTFSICTSPIIHLVCPQTFCIRIEFNFSWDDYNTQEKLKAKVMQNFRRQTTCITRVVQMGNAVIEKRSLYQCVTFT